MELAESIRNNHPCVTENPFLPCGGIRLTEGEGLRCEPGSMLAYRNLKVETGKSSTSWNELIKSYFWGGESVFSNTFIGKRGGGWICLEEQIPGQVTSYELGPDKPGLVISRGSLLASTTNVSVKTKYQGISGIFKGIGFGSSVAKLAEDATSKGLIYLNSGKGIVRSFPVSSNEGPVVIDNDHVVGYTEGLKSRIRRMGGLKSLLLSGEGFVCEFEGNGMVFVDSGKTGRSNFFTEGADTGGSQVKDMAIKAGIYSTILLGAAIALGPKGGAKFLLDQISS